MSQTMELVMNVGIGLLFVIAGVLLLVAIIFTAKPYDQITFATAESLRSALDEACFYGDRPVDVKVALPETGMTFLYQAMLSIIQKGDPNYLIYYEQFPVGEAISWETYLNGKINDRIFAQISGPSFTSEQAAAFRSTITAPGGAAVDVIINNVVLATGLNMLTLEEPTDKKSPVTGEQKDSYYALNYQPDALGKTTAKYLSCGEGNLCVKTKSGIYAYPLKECKEKIDYIQMKYDGGLTPDDKSFIEETLDKIPVGAVRVGDLKIPQKILGSLGSSKQSDFYLFSPCKANAKISIGKCTCKLDRYPVYDYEDKVFKQSGTHEFCTDNIPGTTAKEQTFDCAIVDIGRDEGCYTLTPPEGGIMSKLTNVLTVEPVRKHTTMLAPNAFLLTTEDVISVSNEIINKLKDAASKGGVWQWPWSR